MPFCWPRSLTGSSGSSNSLRDCPQRRSKLPPTVAIRSSGTFTVLGEAVSQLSAGLKAEHPAIPWMDASRIRNRIVHGYWSVDFEVLIATARDDLPSFLVGVETVLASLVEDAE